MAFVYSEIDRNKRKTWLLMAVFIIVLVGIAYPVGYQIGDPLIAVAIIGGFSFFYALISYFAGAKVALFVSQAKPLKKEENARLYRIVENLSITAGIPMPKIYLIDDTAMNAFATGRDPKHAAIAFTTGIVDMLEDAELEGVAAHEISHIKNYDIRLATLVLMLVSIIAVISDFLRRGFLHSGRGSRKGGNQAAVIWLVLAIVLPIVAPIIATLTQLALSRRRESLADASAVLLTRYADGLANALEKLSKDEEILEVANRGTAHLYIVSPLRGKRGTGLSKLFMTHPPIEERIKALREMRS
ncbi:M48 family metallopeptidase [Patescibacteria group bacterium]|nr:M48 family metallopeptidase [Patescibacteria group bacterium]